MKNFFSLKIYVLLLGVLGQMNVVRSADFYISPSGDDRNPGNKNRPFATIEQSLLAVEQFYNSNHEENVTVWLDNGTYFLENPVVFNARRLKNKDFTIAFKALPGTQPVVSGGIEVVNWERLPEGIWSAKLPPVSRNDWAPRELFVNARRAVRARFPNEGFLRVKKVGADRRTHFFFDEGEFPVPENIKNTELVLLHDWSISRIPLKEIDVRESKLTAIDSIGAKNPAFFNLDNWEPHPRYFLENDRKFLDADYEWYYDSGKERFYLQLPASVQPDKLEIIASFSKGLMHFEGEPNQMIRNIHFEGLTFRHSAWQIPEKGYGGVQACHFDSQRQKEGWDVVPAAIKAGWAENCSFDACTFMNLGGTALWLGTGCRNCRVSNSEFTDVSGNGLMIGEGRDREIKGEKWWQAAPEQVARGNIIEKCVISDCGKQFFGAVGIWCGLTADTKIKNNELYNLPYSGVSVGWMWSPVPTPCRNNQIEGNHIHHIMQTLSDGGGIYMLGLQPGSKIIGNRIHDVSINAGRAESNGMFLDEGTTDVVVADNLIYAIAKSPLRFHKATTNLVKNNFLFCEGENPPIRYNNTREDDINKVDNTVIYAADKNYESALSGAIEEWNQSFR